MVTDFGFQTFIPGNWYTSWGTGGAVSNSDGFCSFAALATGPGVSLQKVGVSVLGGGSAGSVARLGLYSDTGQGRPSTLLQDFGTVDTSVIGSPTLVASLAIDPSLVWLACAQQGGATTGATITCFTTAGGGTAVLSPCPQPFLNLLPAAGWVINAGVTGALPSSPSALTPVSTVYTVWLQAA